MDRRSIRTLRPSLQPKSAGAGVNAEMRGAAGSFSSNDVSTHVPYAVVLLHPRRERPCRPRAAEKVMNSRDSHCGHVKSGDCLGAKKAPSDDQSASPPLGPCDGALSAQ